MNNRRIDDAGRECISCGQYKLWAEFNNNRIGTRGKDGRCRECLKRWRGSEEYLERQRERARRNYQDPDGRASQIAASRKYLQKPEVRARMRSPEYRENVKQSQKLKRARMTPEQQEQIRQKQRHRQQEYYAKVHSPEYIRKKRWDSLPREKQDEIRRKRREYQRKYQQSPSHRLSNRMSCSIRCRLRHRGISKNRKHWEDVLGYTTEALKSHLEALFEPAMSWDNYGLWHIDHIKPVRAFDFTSMEDASFKECWSMSNLAPRWATTEIAIAHDSGSRGNISSQKPS